MSKLDRKRTERNYLESLGELSKKQQKKLLKIEKYIKKEERFNAELDDWAASGLKSATSYVDAAQKMKNYLESLPSLTEDQQNRLTKAKKTLQKNNKLEANKVIGQSTSRVFATQEEADRSSKGLCLFCGSDRTQPISTDRKNFSAGKAIIGGAVAGPFGLLAGAIGKGGKKTIWVCANCGKQFTR